jgi:hypothetical protein
MILTITIIIIGMTAKIGRTVVICKKTIESTVLTMSSEREISGTIGSGGISILTTKRDTTIDAKRDTNRSRRQVL